MALEQAIQNRQAVAIIRRLYTTGAVSREEAKILATPVLERINIQTAEIAKRNNKRPYRLDFISAMR